MKSIDSGIHNIKRSWDEVQRCGRLLCIEDWDVMSYVGGVLLVVCVLYMLVMTVCVLVHHECVLSLTCVVLMVLASEMYSDV